MVLAIASVGTCLSLFLLLVLAVKRPHRSADLWLGVWLAAQAASCGSIILAEAGPPAAALPSLVIGQFALLIALGPAPYLYAATALGERRHYIWHAATLAFAAATLAALILLTPLQVRSGAMVLERLSAGLFLLPLLMMAIVALHPIAMLRLVKRRREALKDQLSALEDADPAWLRTWALAMLVLLASFALARINSAVAAWPTDVHVAVGLALIVASILFVGHRGLIRPGIFLAPLAQAETAPPILMAEPIQAREDFARVESLLADEKPHLQPGLTALELADRLGWAPERLTAALRDGGGMNFFDAVNAARVREVQALTADSRNARVSILSLGMDAGFGSKTALYDAFQRHAGCTPAEWRRRTAPAPAR